MQEDFHYYATYCAALLSGYTHEESMDICYGSQFTDLCSKTLLTKMKASPEAATTQLQLELMDARTDIIGLQDITRIWASFHFLPRDLNAVKEKRSKIYMNKYRLICGPNGDLVKRTVELAKERSLPAVGLAMHVLADTWAHRYFAGTPSLVINNTNDEFYELISSEDDFEKETERKIKFRHSPSAPDEPEKSIYTNSVRQSSENSIMNLGHGRAGHLPDYSFVRYRYLPAWDDYKMMIKDNPSDYFSAFCQMIYAMKYLRGSIDIFETDHYDTGTVEEYKERIERIIRKRQLSASEDWKAFGEELSGREIEPFDINRYQEEYINASKDEKNETYIGKFITAAISQKGMVSDQIFKTGSKLVGFVQAMVKTYD